MKESIPHVNVVIAFCVVAVAVYMGFSIHVLIDNTDKALVGDTIGTWKSFAVGAFAFWIGASSGGKLKGTTDVNDVHGTVENVGNERRSEEVSEVRSRSRIVINGVNDDLEGMQSADFDAEVSGTKDGTTPTK